MPDPQTPQSRSKALASPLFIVCGVVLIVAAVGLRPTLDALRIKYTKKTIELRRPLDQFDPSLLPSFKRAADDSIMKLLAVSTEAVGTEQYAVINVQERGHVGAEGQAALVLTYYSKPGDKVPHTPEVCYRQTGGVVRNLSYLRVATPNLGPGMSDIKVRTMYLEQAATRAAIAYCFCANGDMLSDRLGVRLRIAWPGDEYVYFSKIEAVSRFGPDSEAAAAMERSKRLLAEALPILLERHFPLTDVVKGTR